MRCERCGRDFQSGLEKCPHCGADAHYGGNTTFYVKAANKKLTIADLFNGVLAKHPKGTGARMFMSGTALSTPSPDRMLSEWTKPWLFAWVLGFGLIFGIIMYIMGETLQNLYAAFGLLSLGALIVPVGLLIFFWEINIPRDIPLYHVLLIFFVGGALSLFFSLVLYKIIPTSSAAEAAFIEEPGKLLVVILFIYFLKPKYIFGGLLIGAAVGAGFAGMESLGYSMENGLQVMIMRNFLAPGGHIAWAAIEGGALCAAKGLDNLEPKDFISVKFLPFLGCSVVMHFIWNSKFEIASIPLFADVKFILLIAAALFVVFFLIKQALNQVMQVVDGAVPIPVPSAGARVLTMLGGPLRGSDFPLSGVVTLGRDPSCNVVFPNDSVGISRRHCSVDSRSDGLYVMDLGSTSGTFLQNGQRLPPNQWVRVNGPFYLGTREITLNVKEAVPAGAYAQQSPSQPATSAAGYAAPTLTMLSGPLKGSQFPLSGIVTLGRDPSCNVVFPANTPGVSRRHCSVDSRPDGVYVMDLGSTSGTFAQSGQRLPPNQWTRVNEPLCLGSKDVIFYVQ